MCVPYDLNIKKYLRMKSIVPYLTFDGNCEEAFNFYKSIMGGEFKLLKHFSDSAVAKDNIDTLGDYGNKVMHITLESGDVRIMGGDKTSQWNPEQPEGGSVSISIRPSTREEAEKLFYGLSEGGEIIKPLKDVEWGEYFGILLDKYGISWIISYRPE